MKTVNIRELHLRTGEIVRLAGREQIIVTERGRPVALLKAAQAADLAGIPFPKRDLRRMPRVRVDSTVYLSEDRDGR